MRLINADKLPLIRARELQNAVQFKKRIMITE